MGSSLSNELCSQPLSVISTQVKSKPSGGLEKAQVYLKPCSQVHCVWTKGGRVYSGVCWLTLLHCTCWPPPRRAELLSLHISAAKASHSRPYPPESTALPEQPSTSPREVSASCTAVQRRGRDAFAPAVFPWGSECYGPSLHTLQLGSGCVSLERGMPGVRIWAQHKGGKATMGGTSLVLLGFTTGIHGQPTC